MDGGGGGGGDPMNLLLKIVKEVIKTFAAQIKDANTQLRGLEDDEASLRDFIARNNKISPRKVRLIRDMVFEIRDEIEKSAIRMAQANSSSFSWFKGPAAKFDVTQKVGELRRNVRAIMNGVQENPATDEEEEQPPPPPLEPIMVRVDNVVGFDEEAPTIINYLMEEKDELDVISIVGMPGLGKTTLAYKIHSDERLTPKIPMANRIWVPVQSMDTPSDVLRTILRRFPEGPLDDQMLGSNELAKRVRENLQNLDSFLITIDDVWSVEFWKDLKVAFPQKLKQGKILITSELMDVAQAKRDPHKLRFLTLDESCKLLHLEVFGDPECPRDLESYSTSVSAQCDGLPYLILRMGESVKSYGWKQVSENFSSYVGIEDYRRFSLSYRRLPDRLKQCFLYLGMFPEKFKIPVWVLIRLWIAEELILPKGQLPLEQAAREDLVDLVKQNLVIMNQGTTSANEGKTCRVHYMVREFCKYEACYERENLFQEIKYHRGEFLPSFSNLRKPRRLRIDSNVQGFLNLQPSCSHVSSFICFSREDLELGNNASSIPAILESLRILEAKFITYKKSWGDWDKLLLLRHVVLSTNLEVIPKVISKLWNMETLVVHTTSPMLRIKANIYSMSHLRHVETNVPTKLPKPGKSKKGNKLLTLGTISDKSCTENVFAQLRSLEKLGIHGQLDKVLKDKSLAKLNSLTKLKLVMNDSGGRLQDLPDSYRFPRNLTRLTLCATHLDWSDHMPTLELLSTLEKLKLKNNAFSGDSWEVGPAGFGKLVVLHIEDADLEHWTVHDNYFQALRCLVIINCTKLEEIPLSLAKIRSLQKLCLENVEQLKSSALRILQEKRKQEQQEPQNSRSSTFKLYINGNEVNDLPDHNQQLAFI